MERCLRLGEDRKILGVAVYADELIMFNLTRVPNYIDRETYLSIARWLCQKGPYVYFMIFIFCMAVIVIPSFIMDWNRLIMSYGLLANIYEKFSSLGYWVTIPMALMAITHTISIKIRDGVFPGGWRYDIEGIEPNPCRVVERNLFPENIKEELIFWIWLLEELFMKVWLQLILSGLLAYFISIGRAH